MADIRSTAARRLLKLSKGYPTDKGVIPAGPNDAGDTGLGIYKRTPDRSTKRTDENIAYAGLIAAGEDRKPLQRETKTYPKMSPITPGQDRMMQERSFGIRRNNTVK